MLTLDISDKTLWDEQNERFVSLKGATVCLEHSLVAISKWESKWHIPYLSKYHPKTPEQALDYLKCMTITQNVNYDIYKYLNDKELSIIKEYIDNPMTATTFSSDKNKKEGAAPSSNKITTAEEIYYMMIKLEIPIEFQKWHINKLMTLIRVFNVKDNPDKKSKKESAAQRKSLMAARRAKAGKH